MPTTPDPTSLTLTTFLDRHCRHATTPMRTDLAYALYRAWAKTNEQPTVGKLRFRDALKQAGYHVAFSRITIREASPRTLTRMARKAITADALCATAAIHFEGDEL